MPLTNIEGHKEFHIPDDWYKYRETGLSAYIRTKGEERWIGPCIESILDFFDEIVVALDNVDRTKDILRNFKSPKIKIYDYPFELKPFGPGYDRCPADSVHSFAYYTNWAISKTTFDHVCRWDADMLMLPSFKNKRKFILQKNIVRIKGYDVVTPDFKYMSKIHPFAGPEARFHKIDKHIFYYQMALYEGINYDGILQLLYPSRWKEFPNPQVQRISNLLTRNDIKLMEPVFLHVKLLKDWTEKYARNKEVDWDTPFYKYLVAMGEKGDRIQVDIPEFVFKQPEEYL